MVENNSEIKYEVGMYVTSTNRNFKDLVFSILTVVGTNMVHCICLNHATEVTLAVEQIKPHPVQTGDVYKSRHNNSDKLFYIGELRFIDSKIKAAGVVGTSYSSVKNKLDAGDFDVVIRVGILARCRMINY